MMKSTKLPVMVMMLVLTVAGTAAQENRNATGLSIVAAGSVSPGDEAKELSTKFWLQQLVLSALYRNGAQEASPEEWQRGLASPSRIQCRYAASATLALPERQVLIFDEVLLPLSEERYPAYIFIRHGERILSLAKYDPWVLHKVVSEAGLSLYPSLAKVERALF
ncbi:MAG: hypothetical protein V4773_24195 [Verrucomicrobiota bacterium]